MKKHQLAAMIISALSAGVLISCSKPNENTGDIQDTANGKETKTNQLDSVTDNSVISSNQTLDIAPETAKNYAIQVVNTQIIPKYKSVVEESRKLNGLANKLCESGAKVKSTEVQNLREQWLKLAKVWARAEIVNFGPAMQSMSNLYINYYPDERGLVHQGVVDLINDNPALTVEQLADESAIVQGIPGLEEVLYSNNTLTVEQCQYVKSASGALTLRLEKVLQAWQESPETLMGLEDNDVKTGMKLWINSVLSLVETTKSTGLGQPLGLTGNKKGHLPAQAAGQSREIINAKVAALNDALTDPNLIAILNEGGKDTIADELSTSLAEASTLLAQLPEDISDANAEQQEELYQKLTNTTQLIKRKLMPVLGIQVGFNSTDGD